MTGALHGLCIGVSDGNFRLKIQIRFRTAINLQPQKRVLASVYRHQKGQLD